MHLQTDIISAWCCCTLFFLPTVCSFIRFFYFLHAWHVDTHQNRAHTHQIDWRGLFFCHFIEVCECNEKFERKHFLSFVVMLITPFIECEQYLINNYEYAKCQCSAFFFAYWLVSCLNIDRLEERKRGYVRIFDRKFEISGSSGNFFN